MKDFQETQELMRRFKWRPRNNRGGQKGWPTVGKEAGASGKGWTLAYTLRPYPPHAVVMETVDPDLVIGLGQ
jgi:hypothetical protein